MRTRTYLSLVFGRTPLALTFGALALSLETALA